MPKGTLLVGLISTLSQSQAGLLVGFISNHYLGQFLSTPSQSQAGLLVGFK